MKNDNLLAKWLSGEISPEELDILKQTEDLSSYEKIIAHTGKFKAPAFNREVVLQKIRDRQQDTPAPRRSIGLWKIISGAAAALVLVLASYLFFSQGNITVKTANAEKTSLRLPDASEVVLNAGSVLSYSKRKWDSERELRLEGEAFFKVVPGNTFAVHTAVGSVTVLGTHFNVKSRNRYFEVNCYQGSVEVVHNRDTVMLKPGETFRSLEGSRIETGSFPEHEPSWIRDESSFKSVPFQEVLGEFERQYNIKIRSNTGTDMHFTGSFSNNDLETAIKSITLPFHLKYRFSDGSNSEIILYSEQN
ncbi:FecR family protein [Sinomicrobium soli]|uniref:FecR family protein n=1 Tax=Sinomicrobium sp. N-1-3-6 TaxID=2219864 RepID=UPI001374C934|nr:FecR domain-containing protein [Sinomicrobium sp. N-1-3-6]